MSSVELPAEVHGRIERRVEGTDFDSVDEYVTFVLEEVLHYAESGSGNMTDEAVDEDEVKDRLRSLGYID